MIFFLPNFEIHKFKKSGMLPRGFKLRTGRVINLPSDGHFAGEETQWYVIFKSNMYIS